MSDIPKQIRYSTDPLKILSDIPWKFLIDSQLRSWASIRQETFHFNPFLLVGIHILPSTDEEFADQKTGKHF